MKIRISNVFKETFQHEEGWGFHGTLQPVVDMKIYNDDYFEIRQILRVNQPCLVEPGAVITDRHNQTYILGHYDVRDAYVGFRVYPATHQLEWKRVVKVIDPLTGLERGEHEETLGSIWCLPETLSRETRGGSIKVREEVKRLLTGSPVQLGDTIGGERVAKVDPTLGVYVLELQ